MPLYLHSPIRLTEVVLTHEGITVTVVKLPYAGTDSYQAENGLLQRRVQGRHVYANIYPINRLHSISLH